MNDQVNRLAESLLQGGIEELTSREKRVLSRIASRLHVAQNANRAFEAQQTIGDRLADRVAIIGGSWAFVIGFGLFLSAWAVLNAIILRRIDLAFDPYPFIFLNLLLSMLAAIQAPVILMSQNRQAAKDRLAAGLDYEVNLKAELEIIGLHEKMDRIEGKVLIQILEAQQEQTAMLRTLLAGRR